MLIRIISVVFPMFVIAALGYFVGRRGYTDLSSTNKINMDVFVPALVFSALVSEDFRITEFAWLALGAFVIIVGSGLIGWGISRASPIQAKTLVPTMMFNNCGNLGLPLAVLAFGEPALAPAVVMFIVSNFMQFSFGAWLLDHRTRLITIWRVPSVCATLLGLVVHAAGIVIWEPLMQAIKLLAGAVVPLMLFSLGVRLAGARFESWRVGLFGAAARPLAGVLIAAAFLLFVDLPPPQRALLLTFAVLPPAVMNYMLAERYQQEPEKVASMVLIGNLSAILVLPLMLAFVLH